MKVEPGWRRADDAKLTWLRGLPGLYSVMARIAPFLGLIETIAAGRRRDTARTVLISGDEITAERVAAEVSELSEPLMAGLRGARVEVVYELRYRGQAFELPVPGPPEPDPA